MARGNVSSFDIAIIGLGVRIPDQLTMEAVTALKVCKQGFVAALDETAITAFENALGRFLGPGETLPKLTSLTSTYRPDRHRRENYIEACAMVLDALRETGTIAYLTPGNPMVADRVTQEILNAARVAGHRVTVIPGISSVDTALADLHQEMAPGIQIYDASWFVGAGFKPDIRASCFLMQVSIFATSFPVIGRRPSPNSLHELRDYLLQFYPKNHLVVLIRSGGASDEPARILPVELSSLSEAPADAQLGASMYIPPAAEAQLASSFVERMTSAENFGIMYPRSEDSV